MIRSETLSPPFAMARVDRVVVLWAGLLGCAAMLRLHDLGARPLDPDEARIGLDALRNVGVGRGWGSPESTAPGYAGLLSTLFFLFGSSDASARLVSAIAGVTLVGLCWLTQPLLGRGALGVAALLASSPILIESSRSAFSASLMTALLFLVLISVTRVVASFESGERAHMGWLMLVGTGLAAGLATDPLFALQVLALAAAVIFAFDLSVLRERLRQARSLPRAPIIFGFSVTVVIYTTRLLTNPGGFQTGVVDALWVWTTEILQPARIPIVPLIMLFGSECLVLASAVGATTRLGKASPVERFAAAWAAISLALAIVGGRADYRWLAPAILSAALLGGPWLARTIESPRWREPLTYIVGGIAAVPLLAALVASLPALRNSSLPPMPVPLAALTGWGGAIVGAYAVVGRRTTIHGLVFLILAVTLLGTVTALARLSASTWSDLGRVGPGMVYTSELREVERQIAIWEWDQDRRPILVDDRLQAPLGWVLRSNRNFRWTAADDIRTSPAIKLGSSRGDPLPERALRVTIGYRFTLLTDLSPLRVVEWLLWRRSIPRVETYDILLFR
ncbi:MAG TPA: glycosyltransferase family 39 protein [Chloroflexota bacterium]|nr:glycosyltransferase family 39 protein [Chloroflexota bacterium]